jgi:prevent-host-death family protein
MMINTNKMISVTELQKHLTELIRDLPRKGEPLYVLRNNEMAAVIVSPDDYELLSEAEELMEHIEIYEMVQKRLKDPRPNIPWETVKKKHGL